MRAKRTKRGGRKKGTPNQVTKDARMAIQAVSDKQIPKLERWFTQTAKKSPARALSLWIKLQEYLVPKLRQSESTSTSTSLHINADLTVLSISELEAMMRSEPALTERIAQELTRRDPEFLTRSLTDILGSPLRLAAPASAGEVIEVK